MVEKMMEALRARRDDLNKLEALKEERNELEALRVRKLDDLSPEELRKNVDDLNKLKEQMDELSNLKSMRIRINELEWIKENLSLETKTVETLDPIFVADIRLLGSDGYTRYLYPSIDKLLRSHGINYIGDLVTKSALELFEILGFSLQFLSYIKSNLLFNGLRLNMKIKGWPPSQEKIEELKQVAQERRRVLKEQKEKESNEKHGLEYVFILPIEGNLKIRTVDNRDFSLHIEDILKSHGIFSIGDLVRLTERDLLNIPGIGEKAVSEIKYSLSRGVSSPSGVVLRKILHLDMQIEGWPPSQEKIEELIKGNQ